MVTLHRRLALATIAAIALGCSGEITTGQHSGSGAGGGSTSSSSTGAGGSGGSGGGGSGPSGHYMRRYIGDCLNYEEWFSFSPPTGFTFTLIDRNYCTEHSVTVSPGEQTLFGDTIEVTWATMSDSTLRRVTVARVDPMPFAPEPVDAYQPGTAALNVQAYARVSDTLVWHREDVTTLTDATGTFDQQFMADVAFDAPLGTPSSPTACTMTVSFVIHASYGATSEMASETLTLPCTVAPDADLPWIRVSANGFEDPYDGSWSDHLAQLGIYDKYGSMALNVLSAAFYPVFYYVPGDEAHLFQDHYQPWYFEYLHPPVDSL